MKIYVLEFEVRDECGEYDTYWDIGAYSSKELALNAAKELLTRSVHNLRNNLLTEANYVKTLYNEKVTYFEGPNFIDDVTKAIDNSIKELRTAGTACLDYLKVERYFKGETISLHLDELGFDEPAINIVNVIKTTDN